VTMAGVTGTPDIDKVRARSFGPAAADYDRYRPRYPDDLVDDVVAAVPGRRLLEVGAGTGIATAPFVARGMAMTCVEPDPDMAAILSANVAGVDLAVATFEEWSAGGASGFDGLVSGQAWHWTDRATRWANAAAALRGGGLLALFWNADHPADPRVTDAFTAAYDRFGVAVRTVRGAPDDSTDNPLGEEWAEADGHFADLRFRHYHWPSRTPVADFLARVNTTSAHLILPSEVRAALTADLTATLTGYGDEIDLAMTTLLITGVRRPVTGGSS
jgi:SAM-dependent methyltransferase